MKDLLGSLGRNRGLKLLSLLLAVSLWFAVGTEEPTETTLAVSLEMINLPQNMMITSEIPPSLQVRVMGPGSVIRKLGQTRMAKSIDLAGFKQGRHSIFLASKSFSFPRGVQVLRVQPNPLNVTLAATITRTLHINPLLEGKPPEGYEIVSVKARPSQITIKGPTSEIADLKFLPTMPLYVNQLTAPATLAADLDFKNLHLALMDQSPVLVDVNVAPKIITRTISGVVVAAHPLKARLHTSKVTLTLKGPMLRLKELKSRDLQAVVDTSNLTPGRHQLEVSVSLPPDINLVRIRPAKITAVIERTP